MKTTIEPEFVQVFIDPQERFLVNVLRILGRPQQIHRQAEHTLVVGANQLLKRGAVASLSGLDQRRFFQLPTRLLGQKRSSTLSVQLIDVDADGREMYRLRTGRVAPR